MMADRQASALGQDRPGKALAKSTGRKEGGARKTAGAGALKMPSFVLIPANEYKEVTRARIVGLDDKAGFCAGQGSRSCLENHGMAVECENGMCGNRRLQRRSFLRTSVREISKGQWGMFLDEDGEAGDLIEEYVGECRTRETFEQMVPEVKKRTHWYFAR